MLSAVDVIGTLKVKFNFFTFLLVQKEKSQGQGFKVSLITKYPKMPLTSQYKKDSLGVIKC